MVSVILTLLKILGILLLVVLGLAVLILLSILLAPFRYELRGAAQDLHSLQVQGRITWLGRLLFLKAQWKEGQASCVLRLAGIPLFRFPVPERNGQEEAPRREGADGTSRRENAGADGVSRRTGADSSEPPPPEALEPPDGREKPEALAGSRQEETPVQAERHRRKKTKPPRQEDPAGAGNRLSRWRDRAEEALDFLRDEENKALFVFLKKQFLALLKHVLPRTVKIRVRVGLEDPAATGAVLAVAYMFYPLYGEHIRVVGEFEETVLEGEFLLRGRIRILTLLIIGLRIYRNPAVRERIKNRRN